MLTVRAPASSGNLGSGFDALSMALELCNEFSAEPSRKVLVENVGPGAAQLSRGADNLVYQAIAKVFGARDAAPPPLRLRCTCNIPLSRGLGSSSSAIVAGLLIGNRLLGNPLSLDELLVLGTEMEGHPDNVVSCLLGGVQVSVENDGQVLHCEVPFSLPLRAVLFIPDFSMNTHEARRLLPRQISLSDAVFNLSRSALLVAALTNGRPELLRTALDDRLHQPPRMALFPAMPILFDAALGAGALAACLSGAGSTILTLTDGESAPIERALQMRADQHGVGGSTRVLEIRRQGAEIRES
jgi:homoserine kinase